MGDRNGNTRSRRGYAHQDEEDDDDDDDDETSEDSEEDSEGGDGGVRLPLLDPEEEALADAAMARIRRAQARGRSDVKLSKVELAAYQRRLQRMEDEERRRQRRREQRVAVPLSQLGPGSRPKQLTMNEHDDEEEDDDDDEEEDEEDSPPRSPADAEERRPSYPPMGYFPPPSSRAPQRSSTISSRPPSRAPTEREPSSSPFTYTYVRGEPAAALRHPSDPASRPLSQSLADARNGGSPASQSQQGSADPFQYITGGARASYHSAAASLRNSYIEADDRRASHGSSAASLSLIHI